jgi:bifunctional polynucleotide phosphatase/kinase
MSQFLNIEGKIQSKTKKSGSKKIKVAGFDLDHTIVVPKSGKKFPVDFKDWKFMKGVTDKLKELDRDGYTIVVFTNQSKIKNSDDEKNYRTKIRDISASTDLNIELNCYASCKSGEYRKPMTKMWETMTTDFAPATIDLAKSFYCGDAAGRIKGWKKGAVRDFAGTDRMFALNLGIQFYTPEELFLDEDPCPSDKWFWLSKSASNSELYPTIADYLVTGDETNASQSKVALEKINKKTKSKHLIILVGQPASGKSTFAKYITNSDTYSDKYVIVNQDTLKTRPKCEKALVAAFKDNKSVVVDRQNYMSSDRSKWTELARKSGASAFFTVHFDTPDLVSKHLNNYRCQVTGSPVIPTMVYRTYAKNFEKPTTNEGFTSTYTVKFGMDKTENSEEKKPELYYKYELKF